MMQNRWDATDTSDLLESGAYAARLLGTEPTLVLAGGGNASVKTTSSDVTVLHVSRSGSDLIDTRPTTMVDIDLARARVLLDRATLSDRAMRNGLLQSRLHADAGAPSVETLLHAAVESSVVLHTHAEAILSLTDAEDAEEHLRLAIGDEVVIAAYRMPGFQLAAYLVHDLGEVLRRPAGALVLRHHGLVTWADDPREAYERHLAVVTAAEDYLAAAPARSPSGIPTAGASQGSAVWADLAHLRRQVSEAAGRSMIMTTTEIPALADAELVDALDRGPITPDNVIRTKPRPLVGRDVGNYTAAYRSYVERHTARYRRRTQDELVPLDPAPRLVVEGTSVRCFGATPIEAARTRAIIEGTTRVVANAIRLGGFVGLSEEDLFDMEYWELEQAKLATGASPPPLAGQVALVTGAASGIGRACVDGLRAVGAAVVGLDRSEDVVTLLDEPGYIGIAGDVSRSDDVRAALARAVEAYGGVDCLVLSAGIFGESLPIAELDQTVLDRVFAVNVAGVLGTLREAHPLLRASFTGGRVVLIGSKNVAAPGSGAAAYSASKAAASQLARVAALEWAGDRIRVNVVHPDAVFDTGLWTPELLAERAASYRLTVEEYKRRNLLATEVTSHGVAQAVVQLCSSTFDATTGAQIPIDGGSDRVI